MLGGGAILKLEYDEVLVGGGGIVKDDCCVMVVGLWVWPSGKGDSGGCDEDVHGFDGIVEDDVVVDDHGFEESGMDPVFSREDVFVDDQAVGFDIGLFWFAVTGDNIEGCRGFDCG